jgi:hypothetical protein
VTNTWPRQRTGAGSSAGLRSANPVAVGVLEVELEELELEELELKFEQLVEVSVGVLLAPMVVGVDCGLTTGVVVPRGGPVGLGVDGLLAGGFEAGAVGSAGGTGVSSDASESGALKVAPVPVSTGTANEAREPDVSKVVPFTVGTAVTSEARESDVPKVVPVAVATGVISKARESDMSEVVPVAVICGAQQDTVAAVNR